MLAKKGGGVIRPFAMGEKANYLITYNLYLKVLSSEF